MANFDSIIPGLSEYLNVEPVPIKDHYEDNVIPVAAERLAAAFDVSRQECDDFACRSHKNAIYAQENQKFTEIVKVFLPGEDHPISLDDGLNPNYRGPIEFLIIMSLARDKKFSPKFYRPPVQQDLQDETLVH